MSTKKCKISKEELKALDHMVDLGESVSIGNEDDERASDLADKALKKLKKCVK